MIRQLPSDLTMDALPEWEDRNGHVNVQYYLALYELGGWQMLRKVGVDEQYLAENQSSIFDLEHHISYLDEIKIGESVSVHNRMLSCNKKLFQGMIFIINNTQDKLAATIEYLSVHIDLTHRRSTPFPDDVDQKLSDLLAQHDALDWQTPVCGTMNLDAN